MAKKWIELDTRHLGHSRDSKFDGFYHILPRTLAKQHFVDIRCWCEPKLLWPVNGETVIVSHRNRDPDKKGKK